MSVHFDIDRPIRARLPTDSGLYQSISKEYFKASNLFGFIHTLPDLSLFLILLFYVPSLEPLYQIFTAMALGIIGYRFTFVIHDCSHGTLFQTGYLNTVFGWICSAILFTSFETFRKLHNIHHKFYRQSQDPQGEDYNGYLPGRDKVLWHLIKPLLFLNFLQKASNTLAVLHCGMTKEEVRQSQSEIQQSLPRKEILPILAILLAQLIITLLTTNFFEYPAGYLFFIIPVVSLGLFLSRVRSYLEHGDLVSSDSSYRIARTHRSNIIERNILCSILFNYHHEHHLWPKVPSRNLPLVHEQYTKDRLPDIDFESSYVASIRKLVATSLKGSHK